MLRQATSSYLRARAGALTLLVLTLSVAGAGLQAPAPSSTTAGQRAVVAPPAPATSRTGTTPRGHDARTHPEQRVLAGAARHTAPGDLAAHTGPDDTAVADLLAAAAPPVTRRVAPGSERRPDGRLVTRVAARAPPSPW